MYRKKKDSLLLSVIFNFTTLLAIALCITFYIKKNYVYNVTPSIQKGLYKIYKAENIKKGDIVTFTIPEALKKFMVDRNYVSSKVDGLIKRIGAVEGDTITLTDELRINGEFIKKLPSYDTQGRVLPKMQGEYTLKKGEYFMLGDNPLSFDSCYIGIVSEDKILNKAVLIFSVEEKNETISYNL